ncbi:MAG: hypothetical protein PF445_07425 [Melioribacteraceae bacterium]|jgi:hypothetical protein|nr:hypothetical protein [Melioribacteraceae bacterium]
MEGFIIHFSENTSLYLYSSLLQANAAIIAIVGLFVIFKIQQMSSSIDVIKSSIMLDNGRRSTPEEVENFDRGTVQEKVNLLEVRRNGRGSYLPLYESWLEKLKYIGRLKKKIVVPTIALTTMIILNTVALVLASHLNLYFPSIEVIVAYLITLIQIIVWVYVAKIIINTVKKD